MTARHKGGERGSVAIVVAILLPLVLLGMAALTVDVGTISAERRQLQNGADAVALATAKECAETGSCPSSGDAALVALANGNAQDHRTRIAKVLDGPALCGHDANGTLPPCAPLTDSYGDCPAGGDTTGNYVRAYTATESAGGSTILPYFFAQAIVKDGSKGTTQQTCAAAAWGTPGSITTTVPFTIGACEFGQATGYEPGINDGTFPSADLAIALNYKKGAACESWNGHDFPGGFGWLDNVACKATVKAGDWVSVEPGMGNAGDCSKQIDAAMGGVIYLPVYDCVSKNAVYCDNDGSGSKTEYHLLGLAAFQLEGFSAPSYKGDKGSNLGITCPGKANACLWGRFVKAIVPVGSIDNSGSAPDLGLNVIQMVG